MDTHCYRYCILVVVVNGGGYGNCGVVADDFVHNDVMVSVIVMWFCCCRCVTDVEIL